MHDLDNTSKFTGITYNLTPTDSLTLTIFDGSLKPKTICLNDFGKKTVSFGRSAANDIVLMSQLVSQEHGRFRLEKGHWVIEDKLVYRNVGSTNGLIYNHSAITAKILSDGDFIRIDDGVETIPEGVLFVFSSSDSENRWRTVRLSEKREISIGRDENCDIILPHISVSKVHAKIVRDSEGFYIADNGSTNGVVVNNQGVVGKQRLQEKDVIAITNSKLIFTSKAVFYCCYKSGISVDAAHVVIRRGRGEKSCVTGNDISLHIRPGELVAIIGGSGAGKSTILNCMCGYLPPDQGEVYINGINLYQNFDSLKKLIGYVPQEDIVYDNLRLGDMLSYTAKLRLPKDISEAEREAAVDRAIRLVDLEEKKTSFIKSLSGGQRKRASIAVELLSDPNLLFLDEPASGLDPGTERSLMSSLREMADGGKTVILVTHSTLQLRMCDKIVFMGKGGNCCYFGSYEDALQFFGVSDVIDIYHLITEQSAEWRARYDAGSPFAGKSEKVSAKPSTSASGKNRFQLPVLCSRYIRLVVNDRQRLLLLLAQAPVLAVLISLVAGGEQFEQYEMTKSLLFALSCSALWGWMLNDIQEV
ncbi:MAG: ATP-binding cassette domain-containing protein, partial [Clostridiales bacterium]|nr:ATP-binding cassette domain-containing protein [Clostridiales bacterium]